MKFFDTFRKSINKIIKGEHSQTIKQEINNALPIHKEDISTKDNCVRCHKYSTLDLQGYCKDCALLKEDIEYITSPENIVSQTPQTEQKYMSIENKTTYKFSKIDVEHAETVDKLNGIEKAFLDYINSKNVDTVEIASYWTYEFFIDCNYLISKLLKNEYLEISENRDLANMTIDDLKTILKQANLKTSGTKNILIERIKENLSIDEINNISNNGSRYFVITEKGKQELGNKKTVIAKDSDFEHKCYNLILNNNLQEAYKLVCTYESNKLVKRGLNCNWENTNNTQSFNLYIDTTLPFKLPECLIKYEKELKAAAIYAQMMGAGEVKAKSFFVHNNNIDFDKQILDSVFHALYFLAMGVKLPIDFNIGDLGEKTQSGKNIPQSHFEELSIEKFVEQLKSELQEANYDTAKLKYDQLKDGTYNFSYNEFQIGRIKFGKRSSSMQILTKDFVSWLKNETMEIYLSNIKQWVEYIKEVEAERKKYDL